MIYALQIVTDLNLLHQRLRRAMDWTPAKRMVEQQANISTARRPSKASIFESRKHSASTYEDQELVKLMQAHAPKISAVVDKMIRRLRCLKDGAWHFQTTLARAVESFAGLFPFVKGLVGPDVCSLMTVMILVDVLLILLGTLGRTRRWFCPQEGFTDFASIARRTTKSRFECS